MENSVLPEAAQPDFAAFEAGVRARLSQRQALPPDALQGVERLGRLVQVLRRQQRWSLEALAVQTGLPWLWLALLEQGMLLPAELTEEAVHQLGRAFPLQHGGADPAGLFSTLAETLRQLSLTQNVVPAPQPAPVRPRQPGPLVPTLQALGERRELWRSPAWHPFLAGEPVAAAATSPQEQIFPLGPGEKIRVTYEREAAGLRITWHADITRSGEFWVRFTLRDDPAVLLAELLLGRALEGEQRFSTAALGFDPTREPWVLTLLMKEPAA